MGGKCLSLALYGVENMKQENMEQKLFSQRDIKIYNQNAEQNRISHNCDILKTANLLNLIKHEN